MTQYSIQIADPDHVRHIPDIERAGASMFPADYLPAQVADETVPEADLEAARLNGTLWVALKDDVPVGFAFLKIMDGFSLLAQMDVRSEHGCQGLGSALARKAIDFARRQGLPLYLTTFEDIPWNAPFYQRFGFQFAAEDDLPEAITAILAAERAAGLKGRRAMCLIAG